MMVATERVFEAIRLNLDANGICSLTGQELAKKVGASARTVETAIKTLAEENRIHFRKRYGRRFFSLNEKPKPNHIKRNVEATAQDGLIRQLLEENRRLRLVVTNSEAKYLQELGDLKVMPINPESLN